MEFESLQACVIGGNRVVRKIAAQHLAEPPSLPAESFGHRQAVLQIFRQGQSQVIVIFRGRSARE